jgi:hypothetical protein
MNSEHRRLFLGGKIRHALWTAEPLDAHARHVAHLTHCENATPGHPLAWPQRSEAYHSVRSHCARLAPAMSTQRKLRARSPDPRPTSSTGVYQPPGARVPRQSTSSTPVSRRMLRAEARGDIARRPHALVPGDGEKHGPSLEMPHGSSIAPVERQLPNPRDGVRPRSRRMLALLSEQERRDATETMLLVLVGAVSALHSCFRLPLAALRRRSRALEAQRQRFSGSA